MCKGNRKRAKNPDIPRAASPAYRRVRTGSVAEIRAEKIFARIFGGNISGVSHSRGEYIEIGTKNSSPDNRIARRRWFNDELLKKEHKKTRDNAEKRDRRAVKKKKPRTKGKRRGKPAKCKREKIFGR